MCATGKHNMLSLLPLWPGWTLSHWLSIESEVGKRSTVAGEGRPVTDKASTPPVKVNTVYTETPAAGKIQNNPRKKYVAQLIGI